MATTTVAVALSLSAYTGISNAQPNVAVFIKYGARIRCHVGLNSAPPAAGIAEFVYLRPAHSGEYGGYVRALITELLAATDNVFLMSEGAVADTVLVMRGDSKPVF